MRRRARQRLGAEFPELNLVPLLDMVSMLIQLLLINARFGVFTELGSFAAQPGGAAVTEQTLGLVVRLNPGGFETSWYDGEERIHKAVPCRADPCGAADYDTDALRALVVPLKQRFPNETRVVLVPAARVPFEALAATMDALRTTPGDAPMFPDVMFPPVAAR